MSQLAAIHIAKKQLGLDEETYRDVLNRVTGKTSSKHMSSAERERVIQEFRRLGFEPAARGASKQFRTLLEGKYAPKLQALWISGWHLGVIRDNSDAALMKFVKRQTGLDHTRFLHYPEDARKAVEALKKMLEREAGVDWGPRADHAPAWRHSDQAKIAEALIRRCDALGLFTLKAGFLHRVETIACTQAAAMRSADWVRVHKHYGKLLREALAKQRAAKARAEKAGA